MQRKKYRNLRPNIETKPCPEPQNLQLTGKTERQQEEEIWVEECEANDAERTP